jgi:hypothetical protein
MRYLKGSYLNTSTTPALTGAAGRWKLADQFDAARQGTWPLLGVTASGGTATSGNSYNQWSFTTTGSNTFTVTTGGTVYYAIVAGGGGGGNAAGGGGGAGGVIIGQTTLTAGIYTIVVGTGGAAQTVGNATGNSGTNSSAFGFIAVGGGGGQGAVGSNNFNGGSGGGNAGDGTLGATYAGGIGIAGQGWSGGIGNKSSYYNSGGGGGAGGSGLNAGTTGGNGGTGIGVYLPVSNTTATYAGGGGGGGRDNGQAGGSGGTGGGANGGSGSAGNNASSNTGGGGGGGSAGYTYNGGAGGSGIVVIWSPIATPAKTPYVQYLAVAGGGGGGVGGAGAGGVLQGIAQVTVGTNYTITVGSGGSGGTGPASSGTHGANGSNSVFASFATAIGGGGAGFGDISSNGYGQAGGSGGGSSASSINLLAGGTGTTGQGNAGGYNTTTSSPYPAGGGGGYFMPGNNGVGSQSGNGGDGFTTSLITNQSWSISFNGSSQYAYAPSNSAFAFGTNSFTVEAWVYLTTSQENFVFDTRTSASTSGIGFRIGSDNKLYYSDNANNLLTGTTIPLNTWTHVAWVRNGTTLTGYINGVNGGSVTDSNNITQNNGYVGRVGFAAAGYIAGYISNLRVVNGTAVYTSNFTPPTAPLTAITNTSLLTCQNSGFIDNSSNAFALTLTGAPFPVTYNPFAPIANPATYSWSNNFNGSSTYLLTPSSSNLGLGSGDFTIECWVFLYNQGGHGNSNNDCIIDFRPSTGSGAYGTLYILNNGSSVNWYANSANRITGSAIPNYTWTHLAVCRVSGSTRLFINGTQSGSTYTDSINYLTSPVEIGQFNDGTGAGYLNGYVSNLRIIKGTGLYSSNFTPPTTPLTAVTNTQLLTCQSGSFSDASSNNFSLTVGTSTYIASQNPFGTSYAGGGGGGGGGGSANFGYGGMGGQNGVQGGSISSAPANSGAGGGGIGNVSPYTSAAGGSGVVILAYPSTYAAAASTTGSPTLTTANGYNVYKFNASGSITF